MRSHLQSVRSEFAATGKVYAVERTTGEIQTMPLAQYFACEPSDLEAYVIKLSLADARDEQWRILAKLIAETN